MMQMVPGVPPYYMQPAAVPASPYGFPNAANQQPQQQPFPFPPPNAVCSTLLQESTVVHLIDTKAQDALLWGLKLLQVWKCAQCID